MILGILQKIHIDIARYSWRTQTIKSIGTSFYTIPARLIERIFFHVSNGLGKNKIKKTLPFYYSLFSVTELSFQRAD